jgi:hypothetical protein
MWKRRAYGVAVFCAFAGACDNRAIVLLGAGGAAENAYALDAAHGRLASKSYVYDLTRYDIVAPTLDPSADQLFFDAAGTLWFLSVPNGALSAQSMTP